MTGIRSTVALCLAFIAVVVGMFVFSMLRTPVLSEQQLSAQGVLTLPQPRDLAPFTLMTAKGESFDNSDLQDRWTFIFFGFTNCPDICPVSMSVLGQAYQRLSEADPDLAKQFQGILVTVDPEFDTAEILDQYVTAFAADFRGVLGSREALAGFAQQLNATFAKVPDGDDGYQIDHTGTIAIINPRGHYHGLIKMPHKVDAVMAAFQSYAQNF